MKPLEDESGLPPAQAGSLFIKDLTKLDCAVFEPALGVVGQSWHVDLMLTGELDSNGFVYDFAALKSLVRQVLKSTVDHALIIPVGTQCSNYAELPTGELWHLHAKARMNHLNFLWEYKCPKGAVYPIRTAALRPAVIEQEIARLLKHRLPASIESVQIKLREECTEPTEATFRYTHGIGMHAGLCQRLFHGHRSRLEVYIGAERRADLEHFVVRELFGSHVHITTPSQVKDNALEIGHRGGNEQPVTLAYRGSLGTYEATLPADRVFVVERETSIECISQQVAKILRAVEAPKEKVKVVCYEGIDKGAVAEA